MASVRTEARYAAIGEAVEKALVTGAVASFGCLEQSESRVRVCSTTTSGPQHWLITLSLAFSARSRKIDVRLHIFREHIDCSRATPLENKRR